MSSAFSSRTDFEKGGLYCGLPIFEYEELRDATNKWCFEKKAEENDDGVLLKANPMVLSPDSITVKWVSTTTTPNASS
ncbi:hypothetical protein CRG98_050069 [Punica granatum]|uniref:Uncharacterized protein n=1 Tax=Punica granatum TaxID=22663 RepID=A0A2I0GT89_PUNGR|nr:hypothetical protein CRG98_050069 [Punica granatum]